VADFGASQLNSVLGGRKTGWRYRVVYDDFVSFINAEILPRKAAQPDATRLDGQRTGGSREVVGRFRYDGYAWVVHADSHYEPLEIAYEAHLQGMRPFVQEPTDRGQSLALAPDLRARQSSAHKYLYIYRWETQE
jgi:hypothetical protein